MIERDMEDLIAAYPDDFFPNRGFRLLARQQAFAGVGRFDLLFSDRHGTHILMELKAVTAKYEVADQLARYKDELERRGEKNILMWLVAPQVPASIREFLDRIGIEYSEIHSAEFNCVAERHGVSPRREVVDPLVQPVTLLSATPVQSRVRSDSSGSKVQTDAKTIHSSFKEMMENGVLPLRAAHPDHIRLDGQLAGPNGNVAFRFRHHGKVWQINFDTHYERLLLAYGVVKAENSDDPFVEEPTKSGKGTCLVLKKAPTGPKLMFIYEQVRT